MARRKAPSHEIDKGDVMNRMRFQILTLSAMACLIVAPCVFAQGQQGQQQTQQQSQQQTNPPQQTQPPSLANPQQNTQTLPPVDPKEEAAYKAFYDMNPTTLSDYDAQIQAGEEFVKDYPQSRYREAVYARLANAYFKKGQLDKVCDDADKALALSPDDLTVLTQVGWMIPHANPSSPNYDQDLAKAEQYLKHALEVLNTLNKPANLTQEQFDQTKNDALATSHSGLGLVYFRQKKWEVSSAEMAQATTVAPDKDPTDFYVLGVDDEYLQKYPDSAKAFDTCAQISSPLQDTCKQDSAQAKAKEGAAPQQKP
jgi:tetratricopeptide (TPR) repeat protein